MKTITPTGSFDGYPSGNLRKFVEGVQAEVPDDYADILIGKGLATDLGAASTSSPSPGDLQPDKEGLHS